jgi:hypothetical protein
MGRCSSSLPDSWRPRQVGRWVRPEIGPKTGFFGPIPAEMGGNQPECGTSDQTATAANTPQTSQIQG